MKNALKNWRTTTAGVISIVAGFIIGFKYSWEVAAPMIVTGVGLLAAKDGAREDENNI